jgi:hypothetical protein
VDHDHDGVLERPLRLDPADAVTPLRLLAAPAADRPDAARAERAATPIPVTPPFAAACPPQDAIRDAAQALAAAVADGPLAPPPEPPPSATPAGPWTGAALRAVREARGLSVAQLAERTRVTRHHLENVERDEYERLPAIVYLRGILMAVARELRLDAQKVSRSYLDAMRGASGR